MILAPPDYIGSYNYNHEKNSIGLDSIFIMYLQYVKTQKDGSEKIGGRMLDTKGQSTFNGIRSESKIIFTKRYSLESIAANGATKFPMHFVGSATENGYSGYWNLDPFIELEKEQKSFGFIMIKMTLGSIVYDPKTNLILPIHENNKN
jgi:hypothetical protein